MPSMTGFGTGRAGDARGEIRIQVSSVNNRGCQIGLRGDLVGRRRFFPQLD